MYAALVCAGPSALHLPDMTVYDTVLAVNRAAAHTRADHWVFLDDQAYSKTGRYLGRPIIWTSRNSHFACCRQWPEIREMEWRDALFEGDKQVIDRSLRWTCFSSCTALVVASQLGVSKLDVFGADMVGTADVTGHVDGENNRGERRWQDERQIWTQTVAHLQLRGIDVIRRNNGDRLFW